MVNFPLLDLIFGMIFIYFLLSIISSSFVEIILTFFKLRSKVLEKWLITIFEKEIAVRNNPNEKLGYSIMNHCTNTALSEKNHATAYIDAKNFTSSLLEKITYDEHDENSIAADIDGYIEKLKNNASLSNELRRVLLTYAFEAKETYKQVSEKTISEIDLFKNKIETWYDTTMDRVEGNLKRTYILPITILTAIVVSVGLNADSVAIAKYLYTNPAARTRLAAKAFDVAKDSTNHYLNQLKKQASITNSTSLDSIKLIFNNSIKNINEAKAALETNVPLGWKSLNEFTLSRFFGLLASVLAITLGAPFWFDMLNKVSNIRGVGNKPAQAKEETIK